MKIVSLLTALLLTLAAGSSSPAMSATTAANPPHVAVFNQPGFPAYNVPSSTSPAKIEAALDSVGVAADSLDASALSDPNRFNIQKYDAVVLPYGNAYPQEAFRNLKAFHQAGGIFVLSGVPFTHPIRRESDGAWRDMGHHDDPALFGPEGIGVGGFRGAAPGKIVPVKGDPLGLKALGLDWGQGDRFQSVDLSSLPPGDRVIPFLLAGKRPLAAMVVHGNDGYAGAVDVWTTNGLHYDDAVIAYATEQLLARGTLAALAQKGRVSASQKSSAYQKLAQLPRPAIYADLTLPTPPRPYPTLQPKLPPPARHLYVADVEHLDRDKQLLLASLQGIVNRTQPRIYLLWRRDDSFWLDALQKQGDTDTPNVVSDPMSLVETFRSEIKGAVVPDPKVYVSPDIAVDIAGIDDLVIATPELADQLRLPIKTDLRGKFKDNADALHYARTELLPRLNPYLLTSLDPPILGSQIDLIVAAKGMAFWVTGPKGQDRPGANEQAELEEIEATFAQLPLNAVVHGFWWHGEGVGLDEGPGVTLASRFGKITTVSDYVANYSVLSGVKRQSLKQKPQPPATKLDRSKVYVAITVSDGDNLVTWRDYFRQHFTDPLHGTFPIAWGMGPTLLDIAPTQAQWFYDHAAPTDEFICDVSGVGYIDNEEWASALKNRRAAFKSFYGLTQDYMARMDMKTVRFMHPGVPDIAQAAKDMPNVSFLMPDYGYAGERTLGEITYRLPSGQAVFRAATGTDVAGMAKQIRERVGQTRPAFINAFIMNWGMTLKDLKAMLDDLGPNYVPVTPSQLNALYREGQGK